MPSEQDVWGNDEEVYVEPIQDDGVTAQLLTVKPVAVYSGGLLELKDPLLEVTFKFDLPFPYTDEHIKSAQRHMETLLKSKTVRGHYEPCPVCKTPSAKLFEGEMGCEHCIVEEED